MNYNIVHKCNPTIHNTSKLRAPHLVLGILFSKLHVLFHLNREKYNFCLFICYNQLSQKLESYNLSRKKEQTKMSQKLVWSLYNFLNTLLAFPHDYSPTWGAYFFKSHLHASSGNIIIISHYINVLVFWILLVKTLIRFYQ